MLVLEYKLVATKRQEAAMAEAIRTANFVRNKCLRLWMDGDKIGKYDLCNYCVPLSKEFEWAGKLGAQARQQAAERAWSSVSRFYRECDEKKKRVAAGLPAKKIAYPKFKKRGKSIEYKNQGGWKLSEDRNRITFTDGFKIGRMKLLGKRDLSDYALDCIKRVRILQRADGFYCQFVTNIERSEPQEPTGTTVGIDMGLAAFYTDSEGGSIACPKALRKAEKRLKKLHRRLSKKKRGSKNRGKARNKLARGYLKVSRQRKDFAAKAASALVRSHDLTAYEDLQIPNMVKNTRLSKSIQDAAWGGFLVWVRYYGKVYGKVTVGVPPAYTSQDCSVCGARVPKALSERTHRCECGAVLDRDHNAARNILQRGLVILNDTGGHPEIGEVRLPDAWGDSASTRGATCEQAESLSQESTAL